MRLNSESEWNQTVDFQVRTRRNAHGATRNPEAPRFGVFAGMTVGVTHPSGR